MKGCEKKRSELLHQIYSLAYWMTGSSKKTDDLVCRTYEKADENTSKTQLPGCSERSIISISG